MTAISLTTGLGHPGKVTVAFLVAVRATEAGGGTGVLEGLRSEVDGLVEQLLTERPR